MRQRAIASGHMMDEADLSAKYGHKPDQLAAIFANADSFTCPIRGCKMWADPDFITEWAYQQSEEKDETLTLATDDSERAAKRQKTEQTEKLPPTQGEAKELKSADLEKLKELFQPIMEALTKYEESVKKATSEEFGEYIPKKCKLKMLQKKAEIDDSVANVSCVIDSGKSNDTIKNLKQQLSNIKKSTKDEHDEVKKRISNAEADMKA